MNIIVLDYNENFIEFLDPDLLEVTENFGERRPELLVPTTLENLS